jgi:hypothetical protein
MSTRVLITVDTKVLHSATLCFALQHTASTTDVLHDTASPTRIPKQQAHSLTRWTSPNADATTQRKSHYTVQERASPGIDSGVDAPLLRYLISKQSPPTTAPSCAVPHGNFLDPLGQTPRCRHVTQHPVVIQTLV